MDDFSDGAVMVNAPLIHVERVMVCACGGEMKYDGEGTEPYSLYGRWHKGDYWHTCTRCRLHARFEVQYPHKAWVRDPEWAPPRPEKDVVVIADILDEIDTRTYNMLRAAGYSTLNQVSQITKRRARQYRNVGPMTIRRLEALLARHGFTFREED